MDMPTFKSSKEKSQGSDGSRRDDQAEAPIKMSEQVQPWKKNVDEMNDFDNTKAESSNAFQHCEPFNEQDHSLEG